MAMNTKQRKSKTQQIDGRYGSCCRWCKKPLSPSNRTLEHMKPKSMGGKNDLENLRLACRQCNSSRRNNPFPPSYSPCWEDIHELASLFNNPSNKAYESTITTITKVQKFRSVATGVDASIACQ